MANSSSKVTTFHQLNPNMFSYWITFKKPNTQSHPKKLLTTYTFPGFLRALKKTQNGHSQPFTWETRLRYHSRRATRQCGGRQKDKEAKRPPPEKTITRESARLSFPPFCNRRPHEHRLRCRRPATPAARARPGPALGPAAQAGRCPPGDMAHRRTDLAQSCNFVARDNCW